MVPASDPNTPDALKLEGAAIAYPNNDTARLGWYFDLPAGELQITEASQFDADLTLFTTFKPNNNPCPVENGNLGSSWLYVFDTLQGLSKSTNSLDVNGNNNFDDDALDEDSFASGIELQNAGVLAPLTLIKTGSFDDANGITFDTATILTSSLKGEIDQFGIRKRNAVSSVLEGRVKWRQIR